jgi:hypothetical protein
MNVNRDIPEATIGVSTETNKLRDWLHVDRSLQGDVFYHVGLQTILRD